MLSVCVYIGVTILISSFTKKLGFGLCWRANFVLKLKISVGVYILSIEIFL